MKEIILFAVFYATSLFIIVDPFAAIPIYMNITGGLSPKASRRIAWKAILLAFSIVIIFAISGQLILKIFSISVDGFRVVAGIIFFMIGYDLLQAKVSRTQMHDSEILFTTSNMAISPLAVPMLCGPGAITSVLVAMQEAQTVTLKIVLVTAILTVFFLSYIVLITGAKIMQVIGENGRNILFRIMGLIIMVMAVETLMAGLKPIIRDILNIT